MSPTTMATATVDVAQGALQMANSRCLESQIVDIPSTATSILDSNSPRRHDSDSEDDIKADSKDKNVSERRQAQNLKFSVW